MADITAEAEVSILPPPTIPESEARLPRTSTARLNESPADGEPTKGADTVLYLAFGSNMCAETFQGTRKIRPLSAINVTAPALRLTFSIPGLPYMEPCFANTAPRKIPKTPIPDPLNPILPPPGDDPDKGGDGDGEEPVWDKGLVGVVYEVTKEDYARIVATEGGGSSYKEIVVGCIPIPPKMKVPEGPGGEVPRPFLAWTLCAPRLHDGEDEDHDAAQDWTDVGVKDGEAKPGEKQGKSPKKWWWWLVHGRERPLEDYAQPTLRYLNLLRTGAAEHDLPEEYQAYLARLRPYTITTTRQKVGKFVAMLLFAPPLLTCLTLSRFIAGKDGKVPGWFANIMGGIFGMMWVSYDLVLKRVFGDGERTIVEEEQVKEGGWWSWGSKREGAIRLKGDESPRKVV